MGDITEGTLGAASSAKSAHPSGYRIEMVRLSDLKQLIGNPKRHAVEQLDKSMCRFGFVAPVTFDETTQTLVTGHGRLRTLIQMRTSGRPPPSGVQDVGDDWAVPTIRGVAFKSKKEMQAYAIADNQLQEIGGWNQDKLRDMLQTVTIDGVADVASLGYTPVQVEQMLTPVVDMPSTTSKQDTSSKGGVSKPKGIVCPKCGSIVDCRAKQ